MNILDVVYRGWYHILDKTIYLNASENHGIGPKEHSFFIAFLLHGLNIWTAIRYLCIVYFNKSVNFYIGLTVAVVIFLIGYFFYFKRGRLNNIVSSDMSKINILLLIVASLVYTAGSIYLMLQVGDYIRFKLT